MTYRYKLKYYYINNWTIKLPINKKKFFSLKKCPSFANEANTRSLTSTFYYSLHSLVCLCPLSPLAAAYMRTEKELIIRARIYMFLHILYRHMEWVPELEKRCFAFVRMFLEHVFGACFCMFWHFSKKLHISHIHAYFCIFWPFFVDFLRKNCNFFSKNAIKLNFYLIFDKRTILTIFKKKNSHFSKNIV
jgi:hypothetical protein